MIRLLFGWAVILAGFILTLPACLLVAFYTVEVLHG
jgi:hypothetical protein